MTRRGQNAAVGILLAAALALAGCGENAAAERLEAGTRTLTPITHRD